MIAVILNPMITLLTSIIVIALIALAIWANVKPVDYTGIARTTQRKDEQGLIPKKDMAELRASVKSQKELFDHRAITNEIKNSQNV